MSAATKANRFRVTFKDRVIWVYTTTPTLALEYVRGELLAEPVPSGEKRDADLATFDTFKAKASVKEPLRY